MKKAKVILLSMVIVLIFLLCACQQVSKQLEAPQDIIVSEDNIIHWRTVDGASSYIVIIDGIEQPKTLNTQFDLNTLNLSVGQEVVVKVKAIGDGYMYLNSADSVGVKYVIKTVQTPSKPDSSNSENDSNTHSKIEIVKTGSNVQFYIPHQSQSNECIDKQSDERFNYYYYYLGYLENFPLVYSSSKQYTPPAVWSISDTITSEESESISSTVSNSVAITESTTLGVEVGYKFNGLGGEGHVKVHGEYGYSETEQSETSHAVANEWKNSVSKTLTQSFDPNLPAGIYRYVRCAIKCHIYTCVIYDRVEKKFVGYEYLSYTDKNAKNMLELIEYSTDGNFISDNENKLSFDENVLSLISVNEVIEEDSTNDKSEEDILIVVPKNCKENNGYDYRTQAKEADDKTRHDGFDMGALVIRGVTKLAENSYIQSNEKPLTLFYKVLMNRKELPEPSNGNFSHIYDDGHSGTIYDIQGVSGTKVGYGLLIAEIVYEDDTKSKPILVTNLFEATYPGNMVQIDIDVPEGRDKNIKEINVTVVYEIACGSLNKWWQTNWSEYSNWRCDYTIKIKSN